jgi:hypothetical protein
MLCVHLFAESSFLGETQVFNCREVLIGIKATPQSLAHHPHEMYKNTMKVGPKAQVATLGL